MVSFVLMNPLVDFRRSSRLCISGARPAVDKPMLPLEMIILLPSEESISTDPE